MAALWLLLWSTVLPQGLPMGCSLCFKCSTPEICKAHSLTFFRPGLRYDLTDKAFTNHPTENSNNPCPAPLLLLIPLTCFFVVAFITFHYIVTCLFISHKNVTSMRARNISFVHFQVPENVFGTY